MITTECSEAQRPETAAINTIRTFTRVAELALIQVDSCYFQMFCQSRRGAKTAQSRHGSKAYCLMKRDRAGYCRDIKSIMIDTRDTKKSQRRGIRSTRGLLFSADVSGRSLEGSSGNPMVRFDSAGSAVSDKRNCLRGSNVS